MDDKDVLEYWRDGRGMAHITPPGKRWPEGLGFREKVKDLFFLQRVIEFGCGNGRLAALFDPKEYLGIDISEEALRQAIAANPNHSFMTDNGNQLIFADAIFCHTVLLHVPDGLLQETVNRFRTPRVVVSEIIGRDWRRDHNNPPVFNRDMMDYVAAFQVAGYRLHRVLFHPYPHYAGSDLSIMEFHRDL